MKCASTEFLGLGRKDCQECLVTDDRDSIPSSRRNASHHYYVQTGSGYFQSLQWVPVTIFWKKYHLGCEASHSLHSYSWRTCLAGTPQVALCLSLWRPRSCWSTLQSTGRGGRLVTDLEVTKATRSPPDSPSPAHLPAFRCAPSHLEICISQ